MRIALNQWSICLAILGGVALGQAGMLETGPLTSEKPVLDAKRKGMGYSGRALTDQGSYFYDNPAALSFNEKTSFSATVEMESSRLDLDGNIHSDGGFALPIFSLAMPLLGDGGIGFAYVQTRQNDLQLSADQTSLYKQTGGVSEAVLSGSWSYLKTFSLGASYRLLTGSEKRTIYYPLAPTEVGNFINADKYLLARNEESIVSSGWNSAFSFHWEERLWSAFVALQPGYTLKRKVDSQLLVAYDVDWAVGIRDRTELSFYELDKELIKIEQKVPAKWQFGMRYSLSAIQVFTFDGSFADASDDSYRVKSWSAYQQGKSVHRTEFGAGLGYQLGASLKPFASFFERSAIRVGFDYQRAGQVDLEQYRGTFGVGIPLGSRGARVDISTEYGARIHSQGWSEQFVGLNFSLTGLGNWGEPSRRYR